MKSEHLVPKIVLVLFLFLFLLTGCNIIENKQTVHTSSIPESYPASVPEGAPAKFVVGIVGLDVKLEVVNDENLDRAQEVVNKHGVAAYLEYSWLPQPVLADHSEQGFSVLEDIEAGSVGLLIYENGYSDQYMLRETIRGYNQGDDLVNEEGNSLMKERLGDLVAYTCLYVDEGPDIVVTVWDRLEG